MRPFAMFALVVSLLAGPSMAGAADPQRSGGPRVRPKDERVALLLLDGMRRSATVRRLVEQVETSDVIVYIEQQPTLKDRLQGSLQFLVSAGGYRYVRVGLNPAVSGDAAVAAIAHELQHVVEIADHPSVRDQASLVDLYSRIGHETHSVEQGYDTRLARDVAVAVRRELLDRAAQAAYADAPPIPALHEMLAWRRQGARR